MSITKKTFDAIVAGTEAAVDNNETVEELQDSAQIVKRFFNYADRETKKKVQPVFAVLYGYLALLFIVAFAQINSVILAMAILPMLFLMWYIPFKEPFKVVALGVADQKLLQGKMRNIVAKVVVCEFLAAGFLRLVPLHANVELGIWLVSALLLALALEILPADKNLSGLQSLLVVVVLVMTGVLFAQNNSSNTVNASSEPAPTVNRSTAQVTTAAPNSRETKVENEPVNNVVYNTNTDPFYSVNECPGEPEVRRFRPDDPPRQITLPKGCWSAPIEMPADTAYSIEARTNINFMNTLGEVFTNRGWNNPGILPEFQTFRLRSNNTEQQIRIEIDR